MKKALAFLMLGGIATLPAAALAEDASADADDGSAIVVKGQLVAATASAWSVTTLGTEEIREQALGQMDDYLRFVPGMAVRNLGMGGVANSIVIRGFGNGGHGGDLGAVIDGIPLNEAMSHADGYVDLNVVVPLELESLTVYRGPVSALYGNYNRGGLVRLDTRKGGDYLNADASMGSFGTGDLQMALGREWSGGTLNLTGQYFLSDGYRPQTDQERQTLSGRLGLDLSPGVTLALSGRYHHADAQNASYITAAQFETDPYGIDPAVQNDGARKHFGTARADLGIALSPSASLLGFAYGTQQDFTRWFSRPVSGAWRQREESYDRAIFGAGASLNGTIAADWATEPIRYVVGVELFRERTDYMFYDGLDRRRRVSPALADRRTRLNSLSAFTEIQAPLHRLFDLSLGLRADRFTGGCAVRGPETGDDPCGRLRVIERLSPKIGLRSQLAEALQLRLGWAEGFALPNAFVKYATGGQPLDASVFRQTEIGVKLTPGEGLTLDAAAYRLTSSGEVRTVAPGIYENYGSTRNQGVEISAEWQATPRLWLRAVYGHTDTEVRKNGDPALIGNSVAGVPRDSANVDLRWQPIGGWELAGNWRYVGAYQVNAANSLQADPYDIVDLTLSHEGRAPFAYRAYVRVENVADTRYAASVSLIGGQTLFSPGAPRTVRAGIQITL